MAKLELPLHLSQKIALINSSKDDICLLFVLVLVVPAL